MIDRLSDDALTLLRLHFGGRPVIVGRARDEALPGRTVEATREAYRELVRAGLMHPVSTFSGGPEALFRLTAEALARRDELLSDPALLHHRR